MEMSACLQLPAAVLLFVLFTLSVFFHFRIEELHAVDKAITFDIAENANFGYTGVLPFENGRMGHKGIDDVNGPADFWSWFSLGLVPLFWPEGWDVSEVRANTLAKCRDPADALAEFGWNSSMLQGLPQLSNFKTSAGADFVGACPEAKLPAPEGRNGSYLFFHSIVG